LQKQKNSYSYHRRIKTALIIFLKIPAKNQHHKFFVVCLTNSFRQKPIFVIRFHLYMRAVFLFLLIVLLPFSLFAQTKVSGIVVDDNNLPMPYATVAFKGSTIGIVTNEDGKFYLESKDRHTTLVVSF